MKNSIANSILVIIFLFTLLVGTPPRSVQAFTEISDNQVWTTPHTINSDVVITSTGSLTIRSTTLTFACNDSLPFPEGMDEEKIEIIVDPGGTLMIERAIFKGASAGSCWKGIMYFQGLGYIRKSEIRDATVAILIVDSPVEVSGNHIHSIYGLDKTTEDPYRSTAEGIRINFHTGEDTHPVISGNTVENIIAGAGSNETAAGEYGMAGGIAHGIAVYNYISSPRGPTLSNNIIKNIHGGNGGNGAVGVNGSNGTPGTQNTLPDEGGFGDTGVDGGSGGDAFGIDIYHASPVLEDNQIQSITGGVGGQGGTGGNGGSGGHAFDCSTLSAVASPQDGDPGGYGGSGGDGGTGGMGGTAYGIHVYHLHGFTVATPAIIHNQIQLVQGGNGGNGGQAGVGGVGGNGGNGQPGSGSISSSGGNAGDAGYGGTGSDGGMGGEAYGIAFNNGDPAIIDGNSVMNIQSGMGGDGGNGINGATGGTGGAGGNVATGAGGKGGTGGWGGMAGPGGDGGYNGWSSGLYLVHSTSILAVVNNIITGVKSSAPGIGGEGATGGSGGGGGNGGNDPEDDQGPGGDGGGGGMGSSGGIGGFALSAHLMEINDHTVAIINNTFVSPQAPLVGGAAGSPGSGGLGGAGGEGSPAGSPGVNDTYVIPPYEPSDGDFGYGISIYPAASVQLMNNIVYDTQGSTNTIGVDAYSGSVFTDDYNDVNNWGTNYHGTATAGPHSINLDPQFFNGLVGNYHLLSASPCKNTGNDSAPSRPDHDLDGLTRPIDTTDMGAYEYGLYFFIPLVIHP